MKNKLFESILCDKIMYFILCDYRGQDCSVSYDEDPDGPTELDFELSDLTEDITDPMELLEFFETYAKEKGAKAKFIYDNYTYDKKPNKPCDPLSFCKAWISNF